MSPMLIRLPHSVLQHDVDHAAPSAAATKKTPSSASRATGFHFT